MCLLDDGQLGVGVGHGQVAVGRVPGAVQHQRPLLDEAALLTLRVEPHLQYPDSLRVLAPRVRGHERPLGEAVSPVVVVHSFAQDH